MATNGKSPKLGCKTKSLKPRSAMREAKSLRPGSWKLEAKSQKIKATMPKYRNAKVPKCKNARF